MYVKVYKNVFGASCGNSNMRGPNYIWLIILHTHSSVVSHTDVLTQLLAEIHLSLSKRITLKNEADLGSNIRMEPSLIHAYFSFYFPSVH